MVAKCLQNLANLVEFGGKEPYMEVVNPFIIKNRERMVTFLDHLSVSASYGRGKRRGEGQLVCLLAPDAAVVGKRLTCENDCNVWSQVISARESCYEVWNQSAM